jgi:hypothetical protein
MRAKVKKYLANVIESVKHTNNTDLYSAAVAFLLRKFKGREDLLARLIVAMAPESRLKRVIQQMGGDER